MSCVEQLSAIADFSKLGPLFKSSEKPVELTESETEYVVRCVKHTYLRHIVFQVSEGGVANYTDTAATLHDNMTFVPVPPDRKVLT